MFHLSLQLSVKIMLQKWYDECSIINIIRINN